MFLAFEPSLRHTPHNDWTVKWNLDAPDPKVYPQFAFPHDSAAVAITAKHKQGYGWGIGRFHLFPDLSDQARTESDTQNQGDYPIITPLYPVAQSSRNAVLDPSPGQPEDFSSPLSPGSIKLVKSWAKKCAADHPRCDRVFGKTGTELPVKAWCPDRLIHVTYSSGSESDAPETEPTARIVLKSNPGDFPVAHSSAPLKYITLSHSWGSPPDPSAPLGGRASSVLTASTLAAWQTALPLADLPLTFRQAITACAALGFDYLWIDSLCILQDSADDWRAQSAVMGDVYKFAWLNLMALCSAFDAEGFVHGRRDPRVEFGFRAPFATILGCESGNTGEIRNDDGQECILLRGQAKLLWGGSSDSPAMYNVNAPLLDRAWVYQERALARRAVVFGRTGVYWSCGEWNKGEQPEWHVQGIDSKEIRDFQHSVADTLSRLSALPVGSMDKQDRHAQMVSLFSAFDLRWRLCVTSYTLCKLTRSTDRLIAVSSISRELSNTVLSDRIRYLAGLWEAGLAFQLGWITVHGRTTPRRHRVGEPGYVAPSWSWASIEAAVQPRFVFNLDPALRALAEVRAADISLVTDFAFGAVSSGWLKVYGRINRVKAMCTQSSGRSDGHKSISLTDEATGENLWVSPDTVEGVEFLQSNRGLQTLVWMPLTLRINASTAECQCLVLVEVEDSGWTSRDTPSEQQPTKSYMRLGTGNFGRITSQIREDKLLMALGVYPHGQEGGDLAKGFRMNTDGCEEFILV